MTAKPIPVSVVVMTRNEAVNLPACLSGLQKFGEVFVVDSESDDGTAELASRLGAQVVPFRWNGRYPKKKQWCLENLPFRFDWVLYLDADECVTEEFCTEVAALMAGRRDRAGYYVRGRMVFLGRRLRFGHSNRKLALLDRRRARFPPCPDLQIVTMWEVEGHYQPRIDGPVGRVKAPIWHADAKPLYAWFERHNRYSDWEAGLRRQGNLRTLCEHESRRRRWLKSLFRRLPARPLWVFLHSYIGCLGLFDGWPGFHYAVARAFYYWQISVKSRVPVAEFQDIGPR